MSILFDYDPDDPTSGKGADVPSPCIGICQMDTQRQWCSGCFRTIDELTGWSTASNDSKRIVWRQIRHRMFTSMP
jgi:predicted Fe-S protein YdhL (DUF1289 family)